MSRAQFRFRRNENEPSKFEKWSAIATIGGTIISAGALIVSIVVMIVTSDQAHRQLDIQANQQKQDSIEHSNQFFRDSIEKSRQLYREDSLAKHNDTLASRQLAIMQQQSNVIAKQQESQQRSYDDELYRTRPYFSIAFKDLDETSYKESTKWEIVLFNTGQREAVNVHIDCFMAFFPVSYYNSFTDGFRPIIRSSDSAYVEFYVDKKFDKLLEDMEDLYIYYRLTYEDPLLKKTINFESGLHLYQEPGKAASTVIMNKKDIKKVTSFLRAEHVIK